MRSCEEEAEEATTLPSVWVPDTDHVLLEVLPGILCRQWEMTVLIKGVKYIVPFRKYCHRYDEAGALAGPFQSRWYHSVCRNANRRATYMERRSA